MPPTSPGNHGCWTQQVCSSRTAQRIQTCELRPGSRKDEMTTPGQHA